MNLKSKKTSFLILAVTAVVCSKILFLSFNDPEGANLLIVTGIALILCLLSSVVYLFKLSITDLKKLLLAIGIQMVLVVSFYFFLKYIL